MTTIAITTVLLSFGTSSSGELHAPIRIEAGGRPIDVELGHAAPLFVDLDQDRRPDLIVGQMAGAKARVYLNVGFEGFPRFEGFRTLVADGSEAVVPAS